MTYTTLGPLDGEFIQHSLGSLSHDTSILRNATLVPLIIYPGQVLTEVEPGIFEPITATADSASTADAINIAQTVVQPGKSIPARLVKRLAEVTQKRLIWPADMTPEQIETAKSQLESHYVICR